MKNKFDATAAQTLDNLCTIFNKTYTKRPNLISSFSIGIELEIKFKALFPELHNKYFQKNSDFINLSREEKERINSEIYNKESQVLSKFEKTIDCGIPRGLDRYWEFSFTPVYNTVLIVQQIDILKQIGLIPSGKHSLHINIGGLKLTSKHYWVLMTLELLFADKERIQMGFSSRKEESAAWAKKGDGGILIKNENDLIDEKIGFELRTLQFDGDLDKLYLIFKTLISLINHSGMFLINLKEKVLELGLPDSNWNKPHNNPEVWKKYIEHFDYLSNFVKSNLSKI